MIFELLLLIVAFCCIITLYSFQGKLKNYPPGPRGLPIVGNLHQLSDEPYKDFERLREKYGDVFSIQLGDFRVVVLNGYKIIKDTVLLRGAGGRPEFPHFNDPETNTRTGVILSVDHVWEEQRRFVLKNLRDFGFGKKTMENVILDEVKILIERMRRDAGQVICTTSRFNIAVFNALWTITAGERASQSEEKFEQLIRNIFANTRDAKTFAHLGYFHRFAKWFPEWSGLDLFYTNFLPIFNYMAEVAESHKKTYQEDNIRDLIDCYLQQMSNTVDNKSSFYKEAGDRNLVMVLYDLFFGGTETTSVTLSWMSLLLAHHPKIQEKVHEEIQRVVGDSRWPILADRQNMPFVDAMILEVLRYSSLVPILLRQATEDFTVGAFTIPKGTAVYSNIYGVHNDVGMWGDPENFRPERFLSDDGKTVKKTERNLILPFGSGRRFCIGETMARDSLFLFGTSIFQNFRIALDPTEWNPKIDFSKGTLLRIPAPHKLLLEDRHSF